MTMLPAGNVGEVLAGGGPDKAGVYDFLRRAHHKESLNGVSFLGIAVQADGRVWLLVGSDEDAVTDTLREAEAVDAEVIRLENLQ